MKKKNCIPKKTKGKFPGRNKRETNVIRSMRTELSVVSQTQLYENADRIQKGFRMLVIISIFLCLLLLFYLASFLGVYLDFDFVLQKLNSMLLAKGIRFLFSRLGWFGLLVEGLLVLGDNSEGWCNMMAPSGGSGSSSSNPRWVLDLNQQPEGPVEVPASSSLPGPEWQGLPDNAPAPESLRSHVKRELSVLFNIGKKISVTEDFLHRVMEPLQLDSPDNKVGFLRKIAERVNELQREQLNRGKPFPFRTKRDKERLYSVMWEE